MIYLRIIIIYVIERYKSFCELSFSFLRKYGKIEGGEFAVDIFSLMNKGNIKDGYIWQLRSIVDKIFKIKSYLMVII